MRKAAKVVVVVFDGLRLDMVTPERMPRLASFAARSLWFREARSVFPSMTRVATTSVATGAPPAVHGIVGNAFLYPDVTPDFVLDTSRAEDLALAEQRLGRALPTAETFADRLAAAGLSLAIVHTGSAGSAYLLNPRAAEHGHWTFTILGEDATRTPDAVREAVEHFGPLPPRALPRFAEIDYAERVFREHVLATMAPDVALIWFNEPDTSSHYRFIGSPETGRILTHADAAFGRILDAIEARADASETAIIVASDHGQIAGTGVIELDRLLTEAGHPAAMASQRPLKGAAVALTGGNMGEIRLRDGDRDRRDAIARWLMGRDEIGMVFTASEDAILGSVDGTFSTSLVGLAHERGPDLVYVLRSELGPDDHGLPGRGLITAGDVPAGGGMHGGLNRHELNTVLMLGNVAATTPGLSEAPCGLVDIAPTILDLMGLAAPASMSGRSLLGREMQVRRLAIVTHEAGTGSFRQRLESVERDGHRFFVHGGRV